MKKFFTVLLSVILVLAFASTGVFADSGASPLTISFDSVPLFSQIQRQGIVVFEDTTSTNSEFVPLFNDVSVRVNETSSNWNVMFLQNSNYSSTAVIPKSYDLAIQFDNYGQWYTGYYSNGNFTSLLSRQSGFTLEGQVSLSDSSFAWTSSSLVTNTYSLSLPYGNAMRIYSDSPFTITTRSYTVRDTTYNFQKYVRASDDFSYRVNGTYQGVVLDSSLSGNFSLSVYGSDNVLSLLVPWQPTNQNILGRATAYNYYSASPDPTASVAVGSGESFLIWYPYYANNQDTSMLNEVPMDMAITIEYSSPVFFLTYPITGNPTAGDDSYISNTSNSSDSGTSQQTDDGDGNITVTFDNAPTAGGNHGQAPINQNNSILGVLSNLQNTLLGLFNKAIDGIHNLISLGSSFLQSVQVMFSWLPAELLVIITSGFVILLTIGVLKTLWR